jgi:hypothetical protein
MPEEEPTMGFQESLDVLHEYQKRKLEEIQARQAEAEGEIRLSPEEVADKFNAMVDEIDVLRSLVEEAYVAGYKNARDEHFEVFDILDQDNAENYRLENVLSESENRLANN